MDENLKEAPEGQDKYSGRNTLLGLRGAKCFGKIILGFPCIIEISDEKTRNFTKKKSTLEK